MSTDDMRDEELELVKVCGPTEAQMIGELLRNNEIEYTLQGPTVANIYPATSDLDEVRILVHPRDAERAQELIDAFFTPVDKEELQEDSQELGVDNPDEPGGFTS
jgi:hypothetical protein